jgi:hypothetical protein
VTNFSTLGGSGAQWKYDADGTISPLDAGPGLVVAAVDAGSGPIVTGGTLAGGVVVIGSSSFNDGGSYQAQNALFDGGVTAATLTAAGAVSGNTLAASTASLSGGFNTASTGVPTFNQVQSELGSGIMMALFGSLFAATSATEYFPFGYIPQTSESNIWPTPAAIANATSVPTQMAIREICAFSVDAGTGTTSTYSIVAADAGVLLSVAVTSTSHGNCATGDVAVSAGDLLFMQLVPSSNYTLAPGNVNVTVRYTSQ